VASQKATEKQIRVGVVPFCRTIANNGQWQSHSTTPFFLFMKTLPNQNDE